MRNTQDPKTSLKGVKVLSVDDDQFMRRLIERILDKLGVAKVIAAGDAAQALDFLENSPGSVDVVLLDLNMPGMNGIDFVRLLRDSTDARVAELPVVILTDHGSATVANGMIRFGIHGFLTKPVDAEKLRLSLAKALDGHMLEEGALDP